MLSTLIIVKCAICTFVKFLEKWQTLAAAMIALYAAYKANKLIEAQITQAKGLEDKKIEGLHTAYRASLVLTLTKIVKYCRDSSDILKTCHVNISQKIMPTPSLKTPNLPESFEVPIERVISTSSKNNVTALLISLIRNLQIFDSRINSMKNHKANGEIISERNVETLIRQCVHIYSICHPLMEYARFDVEDTECNVGWDVYENTLRILNYHNEEFENLFLEIDRIKKDGKGPDYY